jgi:hypothetical protein
MTEGLKIAIFKYGMYLKVEALVLLLAQILGTLLTPST